MRAARLLHCTIVASLGAAVAGCGQGSTEGATDSATLDADVVTVDTVQADTTPPLDTTPADTGPDTRPPDPGAFGAPCSTQEDCNSGFCVQDANGKVCTRVCSDECPAGWGCNEVQLGGSDPTFICQPNFPRLCYPCTSNDDCTANGQDGSRCVQFGGAGAFCGGDCSQAGCPDGFVCFQAPDLNGTTSAQCIPQAEMCACTAPAIADQAETICSFANEHGKCTGARFCAEDGLSACTATTPAAETCNGVDDDCDGLTDEGSLDTDADHVADCVDDDDDGDGSLDGDDCAPLDPTRHPGAAEVCDGVDQDCDGTNDQGFADTDDDGIADCVDDDDDGDGRLDASDNCPLTPNADQADTDGDGLGDVCDDDIDGDGIQNPNDCGPTDPGIHPGAAEVCDGVDQDCDGVADQGFGDLDDDGAADCVDPDDDGDDVLDAVDNCPVTFNPAQADADEDAIGDACEDDLDGDRDPDATDCGPLDPDIHHGNTEICDGVDQNCNGIIDEGFPDSEGDGVANCVDPDDDNDGVADAEDDCPLVADPTQLDTDDDGLGNACDDDDDGDGALDALDCAPLDPLVHPGAVETCNDVDDNCNSVVDEAGATGCITYYLNQDGDAYGIDLASRCLCEPAAPYTATEGGDCNDVNAAVSPSATEACNGQDDNCDGVADGVDSAGCVTSYLDADHDGSGHDAACVCSGTPGYVLQGGDCDDANAGVHPGAHEACEGFVDEDCDGQTDEAAADGCAAWYVDGDEDGYGVVGLSACLCRADATHTTALAGDCDDGDGDRFPTNPETCDTKDNNCNGQVDEGVLTTFFKDVDHDGYGGVITTQACAPPTGYVADPGDCNEYNPDIHPEAPEVCNGLDDDCNGPADDGLAVVRSYRDNDGDGIAAANAAHQDKCDVPVGWAESRDVDGDGQPDWDCDDSNVTVYPSAPGICDGRDNNCDGYVDRLCFTACPGAWPFQQSYPASGSVARVDLDGDGAEEAVLSTQFGFAVVSNGGTVLYDYSAPVYNYARSAPVFADVDDYDVVGPGIQSLEILTGNGSHARIYKMDVAGSFTIAEDAATQVYDASQFMAYDVDHDGVVEFFTSSWCDPAAGTHMYRYDRANQSVVHVAAIPDPNAVCEYWGGRTLTDLDGDGTPELVFGNGYPEQSTPGLWAGQVYAYRFTDLATLATTAYCASGACFATDLDALFGGAINTIIATPDEIRVLATYFQTADPGAANASTTRTWRFDRAGAPLADPVLGNTTEVDMTDVDDDGVPETVGGAANVGLFDVDGDGFPDRVYVSGKELRVALWSPGAGAHVEQVGSRRALGSGTLSSPAIWDIDGSARLSVYAVDSAGRLYCQRLGEGTWNKGSSLPPPMPRTYRTSQQDNFEPNDGADHNADGVPDDVAWLPSALTAKGDFYSYLTSPADRDFYRVDAAWGGPICLTAPPGRRYRLLVYSLADRFTNATKLAPADGQVDGLVWQGDTAAGGTRCFSTGSVLPNRHGEYRFIVGVETVDGDASPYWPYWLYATK